MNANKLVKLVCITTRRYSSVGEQNGCLSGIRVLDLSRILAGPFCTMLLSDLGAEVIKVEKPGCGDETRNWVPPSVDGESLYFLAVNRNKKSIAVDFKQEEGKKIIKDLAMKSDVIVENYLPGKLDNFGLGYKDIKKVNPRLVYCSISGFGNDGPYSERPGLDVIAASVGGLMSITGPENGPPCKVGVALTDVTTGLYAKSAILAALLHRHTTGVGSRIECNLLSTQVSMLINIGMNYLNAGITAPRRGTAHESIVPYQSFECADRKWLTIGVVNNAMFRTMCEILFPRSCSSNLVKDERFISNAKRVENRVELIGLLSKQFKNQPLDYWLKAFEESGIPYGPVNDLNDVFRDPQVIHNNSVLQVNHRTAGTIKLLGPAVKHYTDDSFNSDEQTSAFREKMTAPPLLGEHTHSILTKILNYDSEIISRLSEKKIIQCE